MSKIRIRKRGNTYSYSFDISKNPRRMKEKGGFATEDEAFDAGVAAYADWKSGNIGITSEKVKLRDYLASWLENVVRPNVKRTTFKSYHNAVGSRITPPRRHIRCLAWHIFTPYPLYLHAPPKSLPTMIRLLTLCVTCLISAGRSFPADGRTPVSAFSLAPPVVKCPREGAD